MLRFMSQGGEGRGSAKTVSAIRKTETPTYHLPPTTYYLLLTDYFINSLIKRLLMVNGSWLMAQGSGGTGPTAMSLEP